MKNEVENRESSVTDASCHSVNETLSQIRASVQGIGDELNAVTKELVRLANLGSSLNRIGGPTPVKIQAFFKGLDPLDAELTDEGFIVKLEEIEKANREPLRAALAYAVLANKVVAEQDRIGHIVEKLTERMRKQKRGPEFEIAKQKKMTAKDTLNILDGRLSAILNFFFIARNREIDGIVRVTESIFKMFPNGGKIVRQAALDNQTDSLRTFKMYEDRLTFGSTKHGVKRVGI